MRLRDEPLQWTITLLPASPGRTLARLKAKARRWGMAALALLAAYWMGTASSDDTPDRPPAPAYTQPTTITDTTVTDQSGR